MIELIRVKPAGERALDLTFCRDSNVIYETCRIAAW
jgi:hypothetical protein